MGHTKEDPETLVLEGSPLLMHIGAESTMITFKMNILSINVMKIWTPPTNFQINVLPLI